MFTLALLLTMVGADTCLCCSHFKPLIVASSRGRRTLGVDVRAKTGVPLKSGKLYGGLVSD